METVFINEDKIKIMLSGVEMTKYRIDADFPNDRAQAEHIIWDILDDAAVCTGFDTENGSFYVQMFPSKSGGCELFVTRIKPETAYCAAEDELHLKRTSQALFKKKFDAGIEEFENSTDTYSRSCNKIETRIGGDRSAELSLTDGKFYIYKFTELENMLGACREIAVANNISVSAAYSNYDNTEFYLALDTDSPQPSEFGAVKCKHSEIYYITEHLALFSDAPVSKLGVLAK